MSEQRLGAKESVVCVCEREREGAKNQTVWNVWSEEKMPQIVKCCMDRL